MCGTPTFNDCTFAFQTFGGCREGYLVIIVAFSIIIIPIIFTFILLILLVVAVLFAIFIFSRSHTNIIKLVQNFDHRLLLLSQRTKTQYQTC